MSRARAVLVGISCAFQDVLVGRSVQSEEPHNGMGWEDCVYPRNGIDGRLR